MITLEHKLEAVLFYIGEPISRRRLAQILAVTEEEVSGVATRLAASMLERGLRLLCIGDDYELVTAPEVSEVMMSIRKEELERDLGKAGAETLSIILYSGPVSRATIEYVRGVNCSFVLRNLLIRGLVERKQDPKNQRSILYAPTPELLKYLGVSTVQELPEYDAVQRELDTFMAADTGASAPQPTA
jgi:segregation and condensation protein B